MGINPPKKGSSIRTSSAYFQKSFNIILHIIHKKNGINYAVFKNSFLLQAGTPSSRRVGAFYKRRPYSNPMPECAAQQVCNAVFMRLKFVQPLCRCAGAYARPCSTRMNPNDGHTINLLADRDGQVSAFSIDDIQARYIHL